MEETVTYRGVFAAPHPAAASSLYPFRILVSVQENPNEQPHLRDDQAVEKHFCLSTDPTWGDDKEEEGRVLK